jgi:hypothetical protein
VKQIIYDDLKEVSKATRSDTILSGNQTHQFVHSEVSRTCFVSTLSELIVLLPPFRIVVKGMFFFLGRHYFCHTSAACQKLFFSEDTSPINVVARLLLKNVTPFI